MSVQCTGVELGTSVEMRMRNGDCVKSVFISIEEETRGSAYQQWCNAILEDSCIMNRTLHDS